MDLKPIYDTGTITFVDALNKPVVRKIESSYIKDPKGIIPNGIYKVFKYEKSKQKFILLLNITFIISLAILTSLLLTIIKPNWFWYVVLASCAIASLIKIILVLLEMKSLSNSINMYRDSLVAGSALTPPFITNLYLKLHKKQVSQNWIITFIMFYGTIILLIFWWLKDVDWWIFHFKAWINDLTKKPDIVGIVAMSTLLLTLCFHIYFMIYRKKRIIDIQSFFGNEVVSQIEINNIVASKNKTYRRAFFISILVVLVFPFIFWIIYKKLKK